jgi:hypothetical protein
MNEYKDFFEYDDIKIDGKLRLSPSSFNNFYLNGKAWYNQNVLKTDKFTGNTATVLGTIIHARIGAYWKGIKIDTNEELKYLDRYKDNPEVDDWKVADMLTNLWDIVADQITQMDKPTEVEQRVVFEIPNSDIFLGGTYDYRTKSKLGDIKTVSQTPKSIKVSHKIQLYIYLLIMRMNGDNSIKELEVLYIVKTKSPKVLTLVEPVDGEFLDWIKSEVKNMVKRLDMVKEDESLVDILFPYNIDSFVK